MVFEIPGTAKGFPLNRDGPGIIVKAKYVPIEDLLQSSVDSAPPRACWDDWGEDMFAHPTWYGWHGLRFRYRYRFRFRWDISYAGL